MEAIRSEIDDLTPRQREVLSLLAEGLSNQQIAFRLSVSMNAIERHITNIYAALDLWRFDKAVLRVKAALIYLKTEVDGWH